MVTLTDDGDRVKIGQSALEDGLAEFCNFMSQLFFVRIES